MLTKSIAWVVQVYDWANWFGSVAETNVHDQFGSYLFKYSLLFIDVSLGHFLILFFFFSLLWTFLFSRQNFSNKTSAFTETNWLLRKMNELKKKKSLACMKLKSETKRSWKSVSFVHCCRCFFLHSHTVFSTEMMEIEI